MSYFSYYKKTPSSSRRSSIRDEDPLLLKKQSSLHNIFDSGEQKQLPFITNPVTQVYRAEVSNNFPEKEIDKGRLLLSSIIRTSEKNRKYEKEDEEKETEIETIQTEDETDELINALDTLQTSSPTHRIRCYSENVIRSSGAADHYLEPLDLSFDNDTGSVLSDDCSILQSPNEVDVASDQVIILYQSLDNIF